jgi:hypothetical protein
VFIGVLLLFWMVSASVVISIGITIVIMVILQNDLTAKVPNENSNAIVLGLFVVAIGIISLVVRHYLSQIKIINTLKMILIRSEIIGADVKYGGDDNDIKRNYYLEQVAGNISTVIKDLTILENLIRKYLDNSPPNNWETVRYIAERSRIKIAKLEQEVVLDFAQILHLIHNKDLTDRKMINNLYYSLHLCQELLRIRPENNKHLLRNLKEAFRTEIAQLDYMLLLREKERESDGS